MATGGLKGTWMGAGENGHSRGPAAAGAHTPRTTLAAALGFALLLTVLDFLIWGRAFTATGAGSLYTTEEIRVFYSIPSVVVTGLTLAATPVIGCRVRRAAFWAQACRVGAAVGMLGALAALWIARTAGAGSPVPLALAAVLAGLGIGLSLLAWQTLFARMDIDRLTSVVLGGCVLFALLAMACTFTSQTVSYALTVALCGASFALLQVVGSRRSQADGAETRRATEKASLRSALAGWGPTVLCLGSLGFVTGLSRTLTLSVVSSSSELVFASLACILAVAALLFAVWRIRGSIVSPIVFYQVAFPIVATGLVVFSVTANDFTSSFASLSYFVLELALIVAIVHSAREAKGDVRMSLTTYGCATGAAYILLGLGTAVGFALQEKAGTTTADAFPLAVIVCIYALALPLAVQVLGHVRARGAGGFGGAGGPGNAFPAAGSENEGRAGDGTKAQVGIAAAGATPDVRDLLGQKADELGARFGLTPRETQVLALVLTGKDSPAIAAALGLTDNTVRTHRKNLYRKLGIHSKQELVRLVDERDEEAGPRAERTRA